MREAPDRGGENSETGFGRILERKLFLFLLDLEVKRAHRYQNFLSILILKLARSPHGNNAAGWMACHGMLAGMLNEEIRESDIVGSLGEDNLVVLLPYADISAGSIVKSRVETHLNHIDPGSNGFEVSVRQVNFPMNGTRAIDLIRKAVDEQSV